MKRIIYLTLLIMLPAFLWAQKSEYFYYYQGQKKHLELNTGHAFVSMKQSEAASKMKTMSGMSLMKTSKDNTSLRMENQEGEERYWMEITFDEKLTPVQYEARLSELEKAGNVVVAPFFTSASGKKIGMSNYFYVKLKSEGDLNKLQNKANATKTEIIGQNKFMPLWYTLSVTPQTGMNAMEIANLFYESGAFAYAEPDLMPENIAQGATAYTNYSPWWAYVNDANGKQWGWDIINAPSAWFFRSIYGDDFDYSNPYQINYPNPTRGYGVKVAVVDDGVYLTHNDLRSNRHHPGYNAETGQSPSIPYGNHGTVMAGIIGSTQNNRVGITGVAPWCTLMPVSCYRNGYDPGVILKLADGINWAWENDADVINCSWVTEDVHSMIVYDAIYNAITFGRGGLGAVVVFPAGNNYNSIPFPANVPEVITVGGIDDDNGTTLYLQNADGLDVVAPNTKIYAPYGSSFYVNNFQGTSASCAFVSGIAALVLSNNKGLTYKEVKNIITSTAKKIAGYNYNIQKPNGTWNVNTGYGLADAYKARLASRLNPPTVAPAIINVTNDVVEEGESVTFRIENLSATMNAEWVENNDFWFYQDKNYVSVYPAFFTYSESTGPSHVNANDIRGSYVGQFVAAGNGGAYLQAKVWDPEGRETTIQSKQVWIGVPSGIQITGNNITNFVHNRNYIFRLSDPCENPTNDYTWSVSGGATIMTYNQDEAGRIVGVAVRMNASLGSTFTLKLTATNRLGSAEVTRTGNVSRTTLAYELSENTQINIYTVDGSMVYSTRTGDEFDIKDTNLPDGIYIIESTDQDGNKSSKKVILKK